MIVGDRSRSLGSPVNCSAIVTIIWTPNFHFASDRQRSQRLPTIATITIAEIESESISAIVAIVNDRQRSQKVNGNYQCSDCSDHNDPSDHMETITQRSQRSWRSQRSYVSCDPNDPSDYMESNFSICDNHSDRIFSAIATIPAIVTIVNDHMETRLKIKATKYMTRNQVQTFSVIKCIEASEVTLRLIARITSSVQASFIL